jgi:hypothetical protein
MHRRTLLKKLQRLENTKQLLHSLMESQQSKTFREAGSKPSVGSRVQQTVDRAVEPFRKGFDAVQQGGKFGPDALSRYFKNLGKPNKDDNKKNTNNQTKLRGNLSATELADTLNIENKEAFTRAMQSLKNGKTIANTDREANKALATGFIRLMQMNPQETQKIMKMLQRVRAEEMAVQNKIATTENKLKGNVNVLKIAEMLDIQNTTVFRNAIQLIMQKQPINQIEQYVVLAQAFVSLLKKDPTETRRIMQLLQRVKLDRPATESKNKKNCNSLKEDLYRKLMFTNK